jgi:hypothetical protein
MFDTMCKHALDDRTFAKMSFGHKSKAARTTNVNEYSFQATIALELLLARAFASQNITSTSRGIPSQILDDFPSIDWEDDSDDPSCLQSITREQSNKRRKGIQKPTLASHDLEQNNYKPLLRSKRFHENMCLLERKDNSNSATINLENDHKGDLGALDSLSPTPSPRNVLSRTPSPRSAFDECVKTQDILQMSLLPDGENEIDFQVMLVA